MGYVSYTGSDQSIQTARAHSMEAWTVAWSNGDDDELSRYCLYSGGDDSVLCKNGGHKDRVPRLPFEVLGRDSKSHSAGVTAILPTLVRESSGQQAIITGSYDEYVRVLLVSSGAGRSQVVAERRMPGGGVWRLKTLDEEDNDGDVTIDVLASCMHAGTRVLKICRSSRGLWSIRVVAKFVEHGSMNYASDARRGLPAEESGLTVISTSFYDRKLCVWDFDKRS